MFFEKIELKDNEFLHISQLIHGLCGINLHDGKKELVQARLGKRLRKLGLSNFGEYISRIEDDSTNMELTMMVDLLSTNLTSFFREENHFLYLKECVVSEWRNRGKGDRVRIWSAGCSSGEEPYTIAIVVRNALNDRDELDVRLLATDISTRMLVIADAGSYRQDRLQSVSPELKQKYFMKRGRGDDGIYTVRPEIRDMVTIRRLNLLGDWPMKGKFDVIFCRNVMIYFDKPTQERLVNRYYEILKPEGHLFIGHAEGLSGVKHKFAYVRPTIYRK